MADWNPGINIFKYPQHKVRIGKIDNWQQLHYYYFSVIIFRGFSLQQGFHEQVHEATLK